MFGNFYSSLIFVQYHMTKNYITNFVHRVLILQSTAKACMSNIPVPFICDPCTLL